MAEHLPNVITPITAAELASALVAAWRSLFAVMPARGSILVLMAQSAHETGKWKKGLHCFNIGNVKSRVDDGRDWTMFRVRERENGKDVYYDPPHPATRFRAFRTLAEGAIDHLGFLRGSKRYADAWGEIENGAPHGFAEALKAGGYYTDPVEVYARALGLFFAEFSRTLPAVLEPPPIDEAGAMRAQGLVTLSLRDLAGKFVVHDTDPAPPPDDERRS